MLYVEGDAQMNQFKDKNGNSQNALSIVQRKSDGQKTCLSSLTIFLGRFEVLDRRDKIETGEADETGESGENGEGEDKPQ